ncbi:MAG: histidinol-phosphatase [Clostridium sp.]|nr:histidinol-phosphatase [Clostridium sp.]
MYANYHTHTTRCQHAFGEDREYVEAAIRGGMKVLGFSDHCPFIFPDNYVSTCRMAPGIFEDYIDSITQLKREYANDIKIYLGLESEYVPELLEAQDTFLKEYPIDYMILGEHFVYPEPYGAYMGTPVKDELILEEYVDLCIEGMESGRYIYLAHPDLIHFTGSDDAYTKHMTRLCQYMKDNNLPVEINLLGYYDKRHYPCDRFLRIAGKIGNKAIVGVDAHSPERLEMLDVQEQCRNLAIKYGMSVMDSIPGLE